MPTPEEIQPQNAELELTAGDYGNGGGGPNDPGGGDVWNDDEPEETGKSNRGKQQSFIPKVRTARTNRNSRRVRPNLPLRGITFPDGVTNSNGPREQFEQQALEEYPAFTPETKARNLELIEAELVKKDPTLSGRKLKKAALELQQVAEGARHTRRAQMAQKLYEDHLNQLTSQSRGEQQNITRENKRKRNEVNTEIRNKEEERARECTDQARKTAIREYEQLAETVKKINPDSANEIRAQIKLMRDAEHAQSSQRMAQQCGNAERRIRDIVTPHGSSLFTMIKVYNDPKSTYAAKAMALKEMGAADDKNPSNTTRLHVPDLHTFSSAHDGLKLKSLEQSGLLLQNSKKVTFNHSIKTSEPGEHVGSILSHPSRDKHFLKFKYDYPNGRGYEPRKGNNNQSNRYPYPSNKNRGQNHTGVTEGLVGSLTTLGSSLFLGNNSSQRSNGYNGSKNQPYLGTYDTVGDGYVGPYNLVLDDEPYDDGYGRSPSSSVSNPSGLGFNTPTTGGANYTPYFQDLRTGQNIIINGLNDIIGGLLGVQQMLFGMNGKLDVINHNTNVLISGQKQLADGITQLGNNQRVIQQAIQGVSNQISQLAQLTAKGFEAVLDRLDQVENAIIKLSQQITEIQSQLHRIENKQDKYYISLSKKLDELSKKLDAYENKYKTDTGKSGVSQQDTGSNPQQKFPLSDPRSLPTVLLKVAIPTVGLGLVASTVDNFWQQWNGFTSANTLTEMAKNNPALHDAKLAEFLKELKMAPTYDMMHAELQKVKTELERKQFLLTQYGNASEIVKYTSVFLMVFTVIMGIISVKNGKDTPSKKIMNTCVVLVSLVALIYGADSISRQSKLQNNLAKDIPQLTNFIKNDINALEQAIAPFTPSQERSDYLAQIKVMLENYASRSSTSPEVRKEIADAIAIFETQLANPNVLNNALAGPLNYNDTLSVKYRWSEVFQALSPLLIALMLVLLVGADTTKKTAKSEIKRYASIDIFLYEIATLLGQADPENEDTQLALALTNSIVSTLPIPSELQGQIADQINTTVQYPIRLLKSAPGFTFSILFNEPAKQIHALPIFKSNQIRGALQTSTKIITDSRGLLPLQVTASKLDDAQKSLLLKNKKESLQLLLSIGPVTKDKNSAHVIQNIGLASKFAYALGIDVYFSGLERAIPTISEDSEDPASKRLRSTIEQPNRSIFRKQRHRPRKETDQILTSVDNAQFELERRCIDVILTTHGIDIDYQSVLQKLEENPDNAKEISKEYKEKLNSATLFLFERYKAKWIDSEHYEYLNNQEKKELENHIKHTLFLELRKIVELSGKNIVELQKQNELAGFSQSFLSRIISNFQDWFSDTITVKRSNHKEERIVYPNAFLRYQGAFTASIIDGWFTQAGFSGASSYTLEDKLERFISQEPHQIIAQLEIISRCVTTSEYELWHTFLNTVTASRNIDEQYAAEVLEIPPLAQLGQMIKELEITEDLSEKGQQALTALRQFIAENSESSLQSIIPVISSTFEGNVDQIDIFTVIKQMIGGHISEKSFKHKEINTGVDTLKSQIFAYLSEIETAQGTENIGAKSEKSMVRIGENGSIRIPEGDDPVKEIISKLPSSFFHNDTTTAQKIRKTILHGFTLTTDSDARIIYISHIINQYNCNTERWKKFYTVMQMYNTLKLVSIIFGGLRPEYQKYQYRKVGDRNINTKRKQIQDEITQVRNIVSRSGDAHELFSVEDRIAITGLKLYVAIGSLSAPIISSETKEHKIKELKARVPAMLENLTELKLDKLHIANIRDLILGNLDTLPARELTTYLRQHNITSRDLINQIQHIAKAINDEFRTVADSHTSQLTSQVACNGIQLPIEHTYISPQELPPNRNTLPTLISHAKINDFVPGSYKFAFQNYNIPSPTNRPSQTVYASDNNDGVLIRFYRYDRNSKPVGITTTPDGCTQLFEIQYNDERNTFEAVEICSVNLQDITSSYNTREDLELFSRHALRLLGDYNYCKFAQYIRSAIESKSTSSRTADRVRYTIASTEMQNGFLRDQGRLIRDANYSDPVREAIPQDKLQMLKKLNPKYRFTAEKGHSWLETIAYSILPIIENIDILSPEYKRACLDRNEVIQSIILTYSSNDGTQPFTSVNESDIPKIRQRLQNGHIEIDGKVCVSIADVEAVFASRNRNIRELLDTWFDELVAYKNGERPNTIENPFFFNDMKEITAVEVAEIADRSKTKIEKKKADEKDRRRQAEAIQDAAQRQSTTNDAEPLLEEGLLEDPWV